jgi:UV DNA damage endonuclease
MESNMKLGYACICRTLSEQPKSKRITTNRTFRKATFEEKGLPYASQIFLQNSKDLLKILQWNEQHNIKFFRLSSQIVSWASEYQLTDLPDYEEIEKVLFQCGLFIEEHGMRVTAHPDHFVKLASPDEKVAANSIRDLEIHGEVFDLLCLPRTHYAKLNIHVGAAYGNKAMAIDNFCRNFERLTDAVRSRLTIENDDRPSLYSTRDLMEVHKRLGTPIVHDFHHHTFNTGGLSNAEALELAASTWGDTTPVTHYSQSRAVEHNDPSIKANAHSDSYWVPVDTYGHDVDVMLECKHKELGLFKMRELLNKTT